MKTFIENHKFLFSIGILYVITFIMNILYSPWENVINSIAITNYEQIISKMAFFGIYDMMSLMMYGFQEYDNIIESSLFLVTISFLFSLISVFLKKIFEFQNGIEKNINQYLLDNILSYIVCILCYNFFISVENFILNFFNNHSFLWKIIIVGIFILLIIRLAILQFIKLGLYLFSISQIIKLLNLIENILQDTIFTKIIYFVILLALVILMNFIINRVLDVLNENIFELI